MTNTQVKVINMQGEDGIIYQTTAAALALPSGRRIKAIYANEAAVVSVTLANNLGSDASTAVPIPAGSMWIASCSAATLTSGKVTAYLSEKNA